MTDKLSKQEQDGLSKLGDVVSEGEGDYNSYNTGTKYGALRSGKAPLHAMTVDQILEASNRRDRTRLFATGKYQIITSTLLDAKRRVPLTGSELFTPAFQEKLFLDYFLSKKQKAVGAYITKGVGSNEDAWYACSREWMSIEVPAGRALWKGGLSNGRQGFRHGDGVNRAKAGSGQKISTAIEHARNAFKQGDGEMIPSTPLADQAEVDPQQDQSPQTDGGTVTVEVSELTPILPGHMISNSVGRGGNNHAADVGAVQAALAGKGHSPGPIDHRVGPNTIGAIQRFQRGFLPKPDGLVEVGKATERALMAGETPAVEPEPIDGTTTTPAESTPIASNATLQELLDKDRLSVEEIARAREMIAKEPASARGDLYEELQEKTQYLNQRANKSVGWRKTKKGGKYWGALGDVMCNLTALAMCMEYLGVPNPHPEMLYPDALERVRQDHGLADRTTESGWGGVAKAVGVKYKQLGGGKHTAAWWRERVHGALRAGQAVMCSIAGHIVRIQDVNELGVVADDPFGRSTLLRGTGRAWAGANKTDDKGNAGEDHVWPWSAVTEHTFPWIAAFHR